MDKFYKHLQQSWDAGDDWDHPETSPRPDPVFGTYCFYWNYTGYLPARQRSGIPLDSEELVAWRFRLQRVGIDPRDVVGERTEIALELSGDQGLSTIRILGRSLAVLYLADEMNALAGREHALVSEIPGTTRDFIEEGTLIQGIPFRIVDTAGLRESQDPVEKIGTAQSLHKKRQADIVLLVIDAARPLDEEEISLLRDAEKGKTIIALNKYDLPRKVSLQEVEEYLSGSAPIVEISAKTGLNWEKLTHILVEKIHANEFNQDIQSLIPINQRHFQLLETAKDALSRFDAGIKQNLEEVFLSQDLWEAKRALESITGKTPDDDILSQIFHNFCVGK